MNTAISKEWAAIDGEEIVAKDDTRELLESRLRLHLGLDPDDYEIVALPRPHTSIFV